MSSLNDNLVVIASSDTPLFVEATTLVHLALLSELESEPHMHVEACVLVADSREREMLLRRLPREIDHAFSVNVASSALRRVRHAQAAWRVALPDVHSLDSFAFFDNHIVNTTLWRSWLDTHATCDVVLADAARASLAKLIATCGAYDDALQQHEFAVALHRYTVAYEAAVINLRTCCERLVFARMPRVLSQLHSDIVCAGEGEALLYRHLRSVGVSTRDAQRWL